MINSKPRDSLLLIRRHDQVSVTSTPPTVTMCAPAEPTWFRQHLLPHLGLPADLPVHFIGERTATATDFDPRQRRFHLPSHGVKHSLRPILTAEELWAANLQYEEDDEEQGGVGEKRKKRRHRGGGLPVLVVDARAGIIELLLSRHGSGAGATVKGEGYLEFINECSFAIHDAVQIWAFNPHADVEEIPLCIVIVKKPTP